MHFGWQTCYFLSKPLDKCGSYWSFGTISIHWHLSLYKLSTESKHIHSTVGLVPFMWFNPTSLPKFRFHEQDEILAWVRKSASWPSSGDASRRSEQMPSWLHFLFPSLHTKYPEDKTKRLHQLLLVSKTIKNKYLLNNNKLTHMQPHSANRKAILPKPTVWGLGARMG